MLGLTEGTDARAALAALESAQGFDLARDVFGNLRGGAAAYVMPLAGPMVPNATLVLELEDPARFEKGVGGLVAALEGQPSVKVRASRYRDAPMWTFSFPELGAEGASQLQVSPTLAIVGGRAIVTPSSLWAKKEVKRALGEEAGAAHALAATDGTIPAEATVVGSMDWGRAVDSLYNVARSLLALAGGFAAELPIDLAKVSAALPESPSTFTRFFAPTLMWARPDAASFQVHLESSFGPETWVGLGLFAAAIVSSFESAALVPPDPEGEAGLPDELATTRERLDFLGARIAVYRIDQAGFPPTLEALAEPTANYPRGFLDGGEVPLDGWGRALRYQLVPDAGTYRLWSLGPDGVDESGGGDDLLAR
jgi:hypothetical protein